MSEPIISGGFSNKDGTVEHYNSGMTEIPDELISILKKIGIEKEEDEDGIHKVAIVGVEEANAKITLLIEKKLLVSTAQLVAKIKELEIQLQEITHECGHWRTQVMELEKELEEETKDHHENVSAYESQLTQEQAKVKRLREFVKKAEGATYSYDGFTDIHSEAKQALKETEDV